MLHSTRKIPGSKPGEGIPTLNFKMKKEKTEEELEKEEEEELEEDEGDFLIENEKKE